MPDSSENSLLPAGFSIKRVEPYHPGAIFVRTPRRWATRMKRAVFLDRDGTIIEERHYLHRPEDVALIPGSVDALARLAQCGFLLFLVTNQSGVGRGYFPLTDVEKVHHHLVRELGDKVPLRKIYIAPEAPDQPSRGRKPSPRFLYDARDEFGVALGQSYMVGDKLIDLECGWNAGVKKCILVRTGYGAELERRSPDKLPAALVVDNLAEAAKWIVADAAET
jgi:D-glycero-D-manno-heptose 1,7-bisphosphate phosphatase